jgi:radical SAM protein with 4Fe4S-binding SPASM domain
MPASTLLPDGTYLAVRREFVLKVDGARPLLYSLDYINTNIYLLTPIEGFALSLLSGTRKLADIRGDFNRFFPSEPPSRLDDLLIGVDQRVRLNPSQTGIGRDGLLELSPDPIRDSQSFDPRQFVISPSHYFERVIDIKQAQRLDTPINIYTIFTHRCVANCAYCYADRPLGDELPLRRWREVIREMASLGIILASPDNGDTFARRDGIDLLECLLEHGMHFLLSTKAYVSRETVRRLVDAGFTKKVRGVLQRQVQLSIDAVDEEVAARILQVKRPQIERRAKTLENFLDAGIMPKVKAVITGLNYDQPGRIVDYFYPCGARVFHFVRYRRSFHRHTDELFVEPAHLPTLRSQFDRIRDQYPDVTLVENLLPSGGRPERPSREQVLAQWNNRIGCGGGWSALGIAADGNAFLCEQMKMDERFYVGSARTQTLQEIWNSDRLKHFIYPERDQFAGTICERCPDFESCMWKCGRCYRDSYFSYGTVYYPPPACPHNDRQGLRMA